MSKKLIDIVIGTRPEAIKMVPVILRLNEFGNDFEVRVISTGQHKSMLDQVLRVFHLKPDIDLDVMTNDQSLTHITSSVLRRLDKVFLDQKSDLVLVHGDTTTTLAAAMSAFFHRIPIGHVEAGLRSFDLGSPFPEEMNRIVTDTVSDLHFVPTETARENLKKESKNRGRVFVTGNTCIDTLHSVAQKIDSHQSFGVSDQLKGFLHEQFVLITAHRRENFGKPIENLCDAIQRLSEEYPEIHFVYPVHPNPNIAVPVRQALGSLRNVHLLDPLDYVDFVFLMKYCKLIITDSGGVQEEGPSLGKPVLVFRDVTERPEALEAGTARLVGTESDKIAESVRRLLENDREYQAMSKAVNPYGDGKAGQRIVDVVRWYLGLIEDLPTEFKSKNA